MTPGTLYRRRQAPARRRRTSLLVVLLKPFLGAVLLVAPPAWLAWWVWNSPTFLVRGVEVRGAHRVEDDWVRRQLEDLGSQHVFTVSLEDLEQRVGHHPWIASVGLTKSLPDRLVVTLSEREPVGVVVRDGERFFVDARGHVFASAEGPVPPGLGLIRAERNAQVPMALAVLGALESLGGDAPRGVEVEAVGARDFRVTSPGLPWPVLVAGDRAAMGIGNLQRWWPDIQRRQQQLAAVDVRFERQVVLLPAMESGPRKEG